MQKNPTGSSLLNKAVCRCRFYSTLQYKYGLLHYVVDYTLAWQGKDPVFDPEIRHKSFWDTPVWAPFVKLGQVKYTELSIVATLCN